MYKLLAPLFLLFAMSACVYETPQVHAQEQVVKSNQKVYEYEDSYILFALRAEQLRDFNSASDIFSLLYENTDKKEYLYRSLQNDLTIPQFQKTIKRVNELAEEGVHDDVLTRIKIVALLGMKRFPEAKPLALDLFTKSADANDALLLSDVHVQLQEYTAAVELLESIYKKNYDEKILDRISLILYVNLQKKEDAISRLETHSHMHGCSELICLRLAGFYSHESNIEGLLSVYLRLYEINKDAEVAKKIVQIYLYKKEPMQLIAFLESSQSDDDTLLQLYANMKNYEKAAFVAGKLYTQTGEASYLGRSAIYKYEGSEDKNDKVMLVQVVENLKSVLVTKSDAMYLNYLGYLLIDHDIDIKEGMGYIQKALIQEPESSYFLDSLAWGHYKLGECQEANRIMQRVIKLEGGDNSEVLEHVDAIQKCLNMKKVVKK
ncbi:MAG: hypothetical protein PHU40_10985 [Sulfurimonas sp.]|jgi:hypothetical protein|nr:hypothetical protein [Sulfurimonas sp.]